MNFSQEFFSAAFDRAQAMMRSNDMLVQHAGVTLHYAASALEETVSEQADESTKSCNLALLRLFSDRAIEATVREPGQDLVPEQCRNGYGIPELELCSSINELRRIRDEVKTSLPEWKGPKAV